ncbi:hypothetical protein CAEBREN_30227 [Caenorhabditis brenneri]|uniref:Uncharacterized protein n=1 Tax=Caenorhabditis brenneri TaxID=135651 RepID=G0P6F6_CAEBE|nr:hypothetical protein CAEBREN_30227 [Caenorhabditis brenneri]
MNDRLFLYLFLRILTLCYCSILVVGLTKNEETQKFTIQMIGYSPQKTDDYVAVSVEATPGYVAPNLVLPKDVAFSVGHEQDGIKYFVLQVHYAQPLLEKFMISLESQCIFHNGSR